MGGMRFIGGNAGKIKKPGSRCGICGLAFRLSVLCRGVIFTVQIHPGSLKAECPGYIL